MLDIARVLLFILGMLFMGVAVISVFGFFLLFFVVAPILFFVVILG